MLAWQEDRVRRAIEADAARLLLALLRLGFLAQVCDDKQQRLHCLVPDRPRRTTTAAATATPFEKVCDLLAPLFDHELLLRALCLGCADVPQVATSLPLELRMGLVDDPTGVPRSRLELLHLL